MPALRRALRLQLPLVESIGSVRASLIGAQAYQFALTSNCAAIDRIVLLLQGYRTGWPHGLEDEIRETAKLRAEQRGIEDWPEVYRSEAQHLLLLARASAPQMADVAHRLRQYQVYACAHLLGDLGRPGFFSIEEIEALLAPDSQQISAIFARQFCERLRKPELLARELAAQFAEFKL